MWSAWFTRSFASVLLAVFVTPAFSQPGAPKDPKAVELLQQSLENMGAVGLDAVRDLDVHLILKSRDGGEGTVRLKTLGRDKWRTDSAGNTGAITTIFNGKSAVTKRNSKAEGFASLLLAEAGNWWIPWLSIVSDSSKPDVGVEYLGLDDGEHKLRLRRQVHDIAFRDLDRPCDVFLDSSTLLPARLTYQLHPADNLGVNIPAEVTYSDYRQWGGLQVPFEVTYSIRGVLIFQSRITQLAVNQGIPESDFSLK